MNEPEPVERETGGDDLVDRYLNSLSEVAAPESLVLRVQAAIAARGALPWWQRSYDAWPWPSQYLMIACSVLCLCGISWGVSHITVLWSGIEGQVLPVLGALAKPFVALISFLFSLLLSIVQESSVRVFYVLGGMAALGYLIAVGTGAFLCRIVQLQNAR